jgi:hypothetical protein
MGHYAPPAGTRSSLAVGPLRRIAGPDATIAPAPIESRRAHPRAPEKTELTAKGIGRRPDGTGPMPQMSAGRQRPWTPNPFSVVVRTIWLGMVPDINCLADKNKSGMQAKATKKGG